MSDDAMPQDWDAVVVGGGIGGLVAAAYLGRAGLRTILVEARETLGGQAETAAIAADVHAPLMAHAVYALDRYMVQELGLHEHGLRFAARAMPLVVLRPGGRHLVLAHDPFSSLAAIRAEAPHDARAYLRYRRALFGLARRLRALWTPEHASIGSDGAGSAEAVAAALRLKGTDADHLILLAHASAGAYLDACFESESLRAGLALDAGLGVLSPQEPGSALGLAWRAAQESCGMQGAVSQVLGGPGRLTDALTAAVQAADVTVRMATRVVQLAVGDARVAGVVLDDGTILHAPIVMSDASATATLLDLLPPEALPFGAARRLEWPAREAQAKFVLALSGPPPFAGLAARTLTGRLLIAERPESAAEAKGAALAGHLPVDLVMEITVPTAADAALAPGGEHVLSVRVPHLPREPEGGWPAYADTLRKRVLSTLEIYAPGLSERVTAIVMLTPDTIEARYGPAGAAPPLERFLRPYAARVRTPVKGLYLCGVAAEPADALSGCAGRIAAALAIAERRGEGGGT